jgi:hypothetical protein
LSEHTPNLANDPAEDPDLHHLRRLLALLPAPEHHDWWSHFEGRHGDYINKVRFIADTIAAPDDDALPIACRYLLLFFSNSNEDTWWEMHTGHLDLDLGDIPPGRYLAEDICRTAWTLFVRYKHPDHNRARWGFPID